MKAAVIQMRSGLDPAQTAQDLEPIMVDAISKGAGYLQTPEMTGCLHSSRKTLKNVLVDQKDDPIVHLAQRLSKVHNVSVHIGSTAVPLNNGMVANRAFLFDNGTLIATYDKIHMFDVDLDHGESWRESETYQPGDDALMVKLGGIQFGVAICYDVRFPHLFREQSLAGAQVLTAPAAFTKQTGEAHWHVLQRSRAIENGAFMISAAQGGHHDDGRHTFGHSIIIDPWGKIIAEVAGDEPGFAIAEINVKESVAARSKIPNLKNARDYQLKTA